MGIKKLFLFALVGQMTDVVSTLVGVERYGCRESNSFLRPLVKNGRYGLMFGVKTGVVSGLAIMYQTSVSRTNRRGFEKVLLLSGILGFAAGLWNLNVANKAKSPSGSK